MMRWFCCGASSTADDQPLPTLLVPGYIFPNADVYAQLAEAGSSAIAIVTGGSSGPPEADSPHTQLYRQTFGRLAKGGMRLVGYVHMDYGRRPLQQVLAAVRDWYAGYGDQLAGIFVDEAPCEAAGGFAAYGAALRQAVKAQGAEQLLVLNPGVGVDASAAAEADIVLTFEDTWAGWVAEPAGRKRGCITGLGGQPARAATAAAVHATGQLSAADIRSQLQRAARMGYSYVYLTDAALPNPWDRLPSYWGELVSAARNHV